MYWDHVNVVVHGKLGLFWYKTIVLIGVPERSHGRLPSGHLSNSVVFCNAVDYAELNKMLEAELAEARQNAI